MVSRFSISSPISPMLKVRKVAPVGGKGWWRQRAEELTTFFLEALSIHLRLGLRLSDITQTGGIPASGQGQLEEDWTGGVQHFRQSTCGNQTSIWVCMRYKTREPMGRSAAVSTCSCEKRHGKRHQNNHIWTFWWHSRVTAPGECRTRHAYFESDGPSGLIKIVVVNRWWMVVDLDRKCTVDFQPPDWREGLWHTPWPQSKRFPHSHYYVHKDI